MNNVPAEIALTILLEKSASSDEELEQHLDIYDICSKKTGTYTEIIMFKFETFFTYVYK